MPGQEPLVAATGSMPQLLPGLSVCVHLTRTSHSPYVAQEPVFPLWA